VCHPSLPSCDQAGIVARQMEGPGGLLTFEVAGGLAAAGTVMESVRLLTPAVSLGANDTLIEHPAGLTHRVVDPGALAASGIVPGLLRVSVGIEDVDDLWADLEQAIERATGVGVGAAVRGTRVGRCEDAPGDPERTRARAEEAASPGADPAGEATEQTASQHAPVGSGATGSRR
jgi:hypothetical protein